MATAGTGQNQGSAAPASRAGRILDSLLSHGARIEDVLIALFLGAMILLVLVQIVLRNWYATGIMGGAEMVRHLVLWVAFIGAALAAREGKHIRIDLAARILPPMMRDLFEFVTTVFSVIVCGILVYAATYFVLMDYRSGTTIAFFSLPVWILEIIIPIGYLLVTFRFFARCVKLAGRLLNRA
ncbi:MAG: TRAP transporter small permease [Desulfomonilia bacterium]|nr:TRAP transporter small permease [Desulfomonilia bacterium]